ISLNSSWPYTRRAIKYSKSSSDQDSIMQQATTSHGQHYAAHPSAPAHSLIGIRGMHCASCVDKVERSLRRLPGVVQANVNLASEEAFVEYLPEQVGPNEVRRAITATGYEVVDRTTAGAQAQPHDELGELWLKLIVSVPLALLLMLGSMPDMLP